jgi:hypothetical protein
MRRSFNDDITAMFRALLSPFQSKSLPLGDRVDSTKMTNSRAKALETPEHLKEKHAQSAATDGANEPAEFEMCSTEEELSKRVRSRADMSQYRLDALKKELPSEMQEEK